jgi:hypothetical protein
MIAEQRAQSRRLSEYTDSLASRNAELNRQLYNRPRQQVSHKKKAVRILGGYFCAFFQRSGSKSRYFSIGVFCGHAAHRSMMSQK